MNTKHTTAQEVIATVRGEIFVEREFQALCTLPRDAEFLNQSKGKELAYISVITWLTDLVEA